MSIPADEIPKASRPSDFIRDLIDEDLRSGKHARIHTRFPPEPNGYLHIGHIKSICLNFGIAREYSGICNLRMDDTNPVKEDVEYVDSIMEDVNWIIGGWADDELGLKPEGKKPDTLKHAGERDFYLGPITRTTAADGLHLTPFYASDYFEQLYEYALRLIERGKAYVCDLTPEETDRFRGAPEVPGKDSPFRERSVAENLDLFRRMKGGEFRDGVRSLRAKIDMASSNVWLRDPVLYRIRHASHHNTADAWCIYPLYDFAHCLSDYIEGITHSLCTLEFEVHRPLYDWILQNLDPPRPLPNQYEFAKLNLNYTVMSKRKLLRLVNEGHVSGWDDPRLPTIRGLRRRGVPANVLRRFAYNIGITKYNSVTDVAALEHAIRDELNRIAKRKMGVLRPIKVIITNYPEGQVEEVAAINNPEDPEAGKRKLPFSREIYIDADDFMEEPPPKYFRLRPGGEVRLKYAYVITCDEVIKNADSKVVELRCTADLESRAGGANSNRRVKGTIHWVSAAQAVEVEVRLYDRLFNVENPEEGGDFVAHLNAKSLEILTALVEPSLKRVEPGVCYQFERLGYFCLDKDSTPSTCLIMNRTITMKDTWSKKAGKF